jgi:hypothetical protein
VDAEVKTRGAAESLFAPETSPATEAGREDYETRMRDKARLRGKAQLPGEERLNDEAQLHDEARLPGPSSGTAHDAAVQWIAAV